MVGEEGLEPSSPAAHAPKACAYAVPPLPRASNLTITTKGDIGRNFASFRRAIAPPFKSPTIAATYAGSARQFIEFVVTKEMPQEVANVRREHVEAMPSFRAS